VFGAALAYAHGDFSGNFKVGNPGARKPENQHIK
jgi:hypothetical protein